jgi:hypothetical protein
LDARKILKPLSTTAYLLVVVLKMSTYTNPSQNQSDVGNVGYLTTQQFGAQRKQRPAHTVQRITMPKNVLYITKTCKTKNSIIVLTAKRVGNIIRHPMTARSTLKNVPKPNNMPNYDTSKLKS